MCEFTLIRHSTALHATKEEAEKDDDFVRVDLAKHKHTYAYQDARWVPTSRQNYNELLSAWFDCDDPDSKTGEPLNQNDSYGCWEEGAKHPLKH